MSVEGETRVIGPWDKIKSSFGMMILGLFLLPGSFVIVYIASKREQASESMKDALPAAQADKAASSGKAVFATGQIQATPVGDPQFVSPGAYLSLSRTAEVYAWEQQKETKKEKDGNTTIEKDYYDCKLKWTSNPDLSVGSKKGCEGKSNVPVQYSSERFTPSQITIGAGGATYYVNPASIEPVDMPAAKIDSSNLTQKLTAYNNSFYFSPGCATSSPAAGCQKVSFSGTSYVPADTYTVVGALLGGVFQEYKSGRTGMLSGQWLKVGPGDFGKTMKAISSADAKGTFYWFLGSVVCFWLGLVLLTGPILQLIEFIPIIGGFGKGLIQVVFAIFSVVVMGLAFIIIEYFWIILVLVAALVGFLIFKKKQATA